MILLRFYAYDLCIFSYVQCQIILTGSFSASVNKNVYMLQLSAYAKHATVSVFFISFPLISIHAGEHTSRTINYVITKETHLEY